jgi:hypothetical protein
MGLGPAIHSIYQLLPKSRHWSVRVWLGAGICPLLTLAPILGKVSKRDLPALAQAEYVQRFGSPANELSFTVSSPMPSGHRWACGFSTQTQLALRSSLAKPGLELASMAPLNTCLRFVQTSTRNVAGESANGGSLHALVVEEDAVTLINKDTDSYYEVSCDSIEPSDDSLDVHLERLAITMPSQLITLIDPFARCRDKVTDALQLQAPILPAWLERLANSTNGTA